MYAYSDTRVDVMIRAFCFLFLKWGSGKRKKSFVSCMSRLDLCEMRVQKIQEMRKAVIVGEIASKM